MERKLLYICVGIGVCVFVILSTVISLIVYNYYNSEATSCTEGPKLLIDHDGGADDAMAILLTILYEKYFDGPKLVALTTCHGNVNETQVFLNSQRILDLAERPDIPIYRGSTASIVKSVPSDYYFGIDGLGDMENVHFNPIPAQPEHAINTLIDISKKFAGELTVIVIGPLTNIAMAIKIDNQLISRLAHLYIAAGNIYSEVYPTAEFNALIDVEAYYIVVENSTPDKVTFIPFSPFYATHNISMDWRLNVLGAIDTKIMQNLNQFERLSNKNETTWTNLDPCAIGMVLDENLIQQQRCSNNSILLCGDERGKNTNVFTTCHDSNVRLAYPAPDEGFKRFFYDVFSAEL